MQILNSYNKKGYIYEHILLDSGKTKLVMQHRRIWEESFGQIPEGHDIHHIDHNRANNCLENLMCLPSKLHTLIFHNIADIKLTPEVVYE